MSATKIFLSSSSESLASLNCTNASEYVNDVESRGNVPLCWSIVLKLEDEIFYRSYIHKNGFKIRIATSHKYARNNDLSSRLYICKKASKPTVVKSSVNDECHNDKIRRQRLNRNNIMQT